MSHQTMAEDNTFKPGDVVRLKSGGPLMTVELAHQSGGRHIVNCIWFSDPNAAKPNTHGFAAVLVEAATHPPGVGG